MSRELLIQLLRVEQIREYINERWINIVVATQIRSLRKKHGWTQAQLAEITGTPMQFCDVCGMPVTGTRVVTRGRGASPAMAERLLRVCDSCFVEIEGGELSVSDDGADTLGTGVEV